MVGCLGTHRQRSDLSATFGSGLGFLVGGDVDQCISILRFPLAMRSVEFNIEASERKRCVLIDDDGLLSIETCVFVVMKANGSHNTFIHHLTSPLFILVALFLSFLLLSIAYLPITWFPWLMYLTKDDVQRSKL